MANTANKANRGARHKSIDEALGAINIEVFWQFTAIAAKSLINSEAMKVILSNRCPPTLPNMAAVPAGAPRTPRYYVERPVFQEAADHFIHPDNALAPYTLLSVWGEQGKRCWSPLSYSIRVFGSTFRGGISWVRIGRDAKNHLLPLL